MANPGTTAYPLTGDDVVDGMTNGYRWVLNADRTIDWAVAGGFSGETWTDASVVAQYLNAALATYSYYADVRFNYLGTYSTPGTAYSAGSEITLSLSGSTSVFSSTSIWAIGMFPKPTPTYYVGDSGDVFLNIRSSANYLPSYAPGTAGWALLLHELGHALGLKHPHDNGGTGRPTLSQVGLGGFNQDFGTIMSYEDSYQWNLIQWEPASPMILDVLAIQYLYGKNMSTNTGNNLYTLTRIEDYVTVWDAAGNDTVSAQGQAEGWFIWLGEAGLSHLVVETVGIALPLADVSNSAPRTLIWLEGSLENAVGSSAADVIVGSAQANLLTGGAGNDSIDGAGGTDTIVMTGSRSQYRISFSSVANTYSIADTVSGRDGTDTVKNIEQVQFADQLAAIGSLLPPARADMIAALGVYRAFVGAVPSAALYSSIAGNVGSSSVATYAATLAGSYAGTTSTQLATQVLSDFGVVASALGGATPAVSYAVLQAAVDQIFAAFPNARGQVVLNMVNLLAGLEGDPVFGAAARTFNAKLSADYAALAANSDAPQLALLEIAGSVTVLSAS